MTKEQVSINRYYALNMDIEIARISARLREIVSRELHKRGVIVAISGGIDSSVCAALAVQAFGKSKVYGLILPEKDSSEESAVKAKCLAAHLSIDYEVHDIAPTLDAIGCYRWRDDAVRRMFPDYNTNWKYKITISGGLDGRYNSFRLVVKTDKGEMHEKALALKEYLQLVAATNYKQRIRKTIEYFHADRLNFAVVGTPNRLEYDQGFFVKNGDGSADVKPIAHLYKTHVYDIARHLALPETIVNSLPSTDTYSLEQGQDEFYFALPYQEMDVALWAENQKKTAAELAAMLEISEQQAQRIFQDILTKRRATAYLHSAPVLIEPINIRR